MSGVDEVWADFDAQEDAPRFALELTEEEARALANLCAIRHEEHSPEVHHRGMMIADRLANDLLPLYKRRRDATRNRLSSPQRGPTMLPTRSTTEGGNSGTHLSPDDEEVHALLKAAQGRAVLQGQAHEGRSLVLVQVLHPRLRPRIREAEERGEQVKRTGYFSILLITATLVATSCGGDNGDEAATETVTVEQASDPISCLESAGLSGAEQRDANLWRAFDDRDGTIVLIDLHESPAVAQENADLTPGVWTEVVDSYLVSGPAKPPLGQSTVGEENVQAVASCLAG
jgi:hypothetical protein